MLVDDLPEQLVIFIPVVATDVVEQSPVDTVDFAIGEPVGSDQRVEAASVNARSSARAQAVSTNSKAARRSRLRKTSIAAQHTPRDKRAQYAERRMDVGRRPV
jgi:hypothetical protein